MKPGEFIKVFDTIAEAPGGVGYLRRIILDFAVQGKLVPQNPNHEPSSKLLKRIAAEKARLIKSGEIRRQTVKSVDEKSEHSDRLPTGWSSTRLAHTTVCLDYLRKPINETERKQRIEGKSQTELFPYFGATKQQGWIDDYIFDEELVLLGEDGVPFLDPLRPKAYLVTGKSWVNNHAHVFRAIFVSPSYLIYCLNVFDYAGRVTGTTRSKLNQARALDIPIMLPPLAEQHQIVAKVNELSGLIDLLEVARNKREVLRTAARDSALDILRNATTTEQVRNAWTRIAERMDDLFTDPADLAPLREAVLQLAIHGRLVTQNGHEDPPEALTAKLTEGKERLLAEKTVLKPRYPCGIPVDRTPFRIPRTWRWLRLGDVASIVGGGTPKSSEPAYWSDGEDIPWLTPADMRRQTSRYMERGRRDISAEGLRRSSAQMLPKGSVLFSSRAPIGHVGIAAKPLTTNQGFKSCVPYIQSMSEYLYLFLRYAGPRIDTDATGTTFKEVSGKAVALIPVPIPSFSEQHRIVAKVDELMALIDQLERYFIAKEEFHGDFAGAVCSFAKHGV